MKATERHFTVLLSIMLGTCKVVVKAFGSVDEKPKCNIQMKAILKPFCDAVYYSAQGGSNF